MGRDTKASDWEFAGILSTTASAVVAAGGWLFTFRSKAANHWEDFVMVGAGAGTPGVSVEVSLPSFTEIDLSWSKITCTRPFSANELHLSSGAIGSAGASIFGLGYSRLYASAGIIPDFSAKGRNATLFINQSNDGLGVLGEKGSKPGAKGLKAPTSAGAIGVVGVWISAGEIVKGILDAAKAVGTVAVYALSAGLFQAGEALLTGRGQAVSYKFSNGYAAMLANLTSTDPDLSGYGTLKNLDWKGYLYRYGTLYVEGGTKANDALSAVEQLGQAAILQEVLKYGNMKGGDAWIDAKHLHRRKYGLDDETRRLRYLDILYQQVKDGRTLGVRIDG